MGVISVRDCGTADLDEAWRIRRLAFGGPSEPDPDWDAAPTGWQGWVAELDGRMCGFARAWSHRQFFGGRAVPMAGLASVAVDPHARRHGVASGILDAALPAMRAAGQPVSALFPSVAALYRRRGWEQVGVAERVEVAPCVLLDTPPPDGPVELRPAGVDDLAELRGCYLRLASTVDGMLDRSGPPFQLERMLELDVVTVATGPDGHRGYVSGNREGSQLVLYDLVALDADAARALLRSVGSWSGVLASVSVRLLEPRELLAAQLGYEVAVEPWMLRVVDLPAAVAARGWPLAGLLRPGLTIDIELLDEHAPWHAGRHRLVVDGGRVVIEPGAGDGAVRLTARGLAAWYAGAASTAALRRAGLLTGDAAAVIVLDALTGTPGPARMANHF